MNIIKHKMDFEITKWIGEDKKFFPVNTDKTPKVKWTIEAVDSAKFRKQWPGEKNAGLVCGGNLLVVDVDTKNGGSKESIWELGFPSDTLLVKTPSGGLHAYYEKDPASVINNSVQRLAAGIDIRAEGGYVLVPESEGYEIIQSNKPKKLTPELLLLLVTPPKKTPLVSPGNDIIPEGMRDRLLFEKGCALRRRASEREVSIYLHALNNQLCSPCLDSQQIEKIISQVCGYAQEDTGEEFDDLGADDLTLEGAATETFLWRQHIPDAQPMLLVARGGLGKSSLMLWAAKEIMDTDSSAEVLWLPVENNMTDTRVKMEAMGIGNNPRFRTMRRKGGSYTMNFADDKDLLALDNFMSKRKTKLVVIDSLRAMSSKDVNSAEIGRVMSNIQGVVCEKHHASLVYIHHANKNQDYGPVNRIAGSYSIDAQVRIAYELSHGSENVRFMKPIKNNLLNKPPELTFVKDGNNFFVTS